MGAALALSVGVVGVIGALFMGIGASGALTFWLARKYRKLEISRSDGRLIAMIDIDSLEEDDPEKLKHTLETIKKAKRESIAA